MDVLVLNADLGPLHRVSFAAEYRDRYDFTVTEVAARNTRSLRAHARAGFDTLQVYADPTTGEQWHVIALDFA